MTVILWTTILHYSSVAPFIPLSSFVWTSIGIWKVFGRSISPSCPKILVLSHLMRDNFLIRWLTRAFSSLVARAKFSWTSYAPWFLFSFLEKLLIGFNHANLTIWLTPALRIWSSLWSCLPIFNHENIIIWLTLALRIWSSLWLYSSKLNLCDNFTLIKIFIVYLVLLVELSMTGFLSFFFFWFFFMVNNTFRSFKKTTFIHVGKNSPLFILDSMDEVTVCRWVIQGNEFLFWNIWRSCMSLHIFIIVLSTRETILLLLLFVLELVDFFHLSLVIYSIRR